MKNRNQKILFAVVLILSAAALFAQPSGVGGGQGQGGLPPGGGGGTGAPIDGGVAGLLIGVVSYAYHKFKGEKE